MDTFLLTFLIHWLQTSLEADLFASWWGALLKVHLSRAFYPVFKDGVSRGRTAELPNRILYFTKPAFVKISFAIS